MAGGAVEEDGVLRFAEALAEAGGEGGMILDEGGQLHGGVVAAGLEHLHGAGAADAVVAEDVLDVGGDAGIGEGGVDGFRRVGGVGLGGEPVVPALAEGGGFGRASTSAASSSTRTRRTG